MRINDINTQILVTRYGNAAKTRASDVETKPDGGVDNVRLSPEAKGWLDALKAARDSDPVNLQKVQDIAGRIRKGTYSVSAREVAESILGK
jgi:flagellar biosynthesis anti-sigma factor FlgM